MDYPSLTDSEVMESYPIGTRVQLIHNEIEYGTIDGYTAAGAPFMVAVVWDLGGESWVWPSELRAVGSEG